MQLFRRRILAERILLAGAPEDFDSISQKCSRWEATLRPSSSHDASHRWSCAKPVAGATVPDGNTADKHAPHHTMHAVQVDTANCSEWLDTPRVSVICD